MLQFFLFANDFFNVIDLNMHLIDLFLHLFNINFHSTAVYKKDYFY